MKPEQFSWNLIEQFRTDQNLKWNENYFVLFCFLNRYIILNKTERNWPFWPAQLGLCFTTGSPHITCCVLATWLLLVNSGTVKCGIQTYRTTDTCLVTFTAVLTYDPCLICNQCCNSDGSFFPIACSIDDKYHHCHHE